MELYYTVQPLGMVRQQNIAALTVDIPCTIINYGKVIGKGGNGGWAGGGGQSGGPAIKINSGISGVTITNHSGAYIAGGGGGGGGGSRSGKYAGGGGGAGGGAGGGSGGAGGALNATGGHVGGVAAQRHAWGGGAGGGGGFGHSSYPGGGGGRILPGIGGYYSFFHPQIIATTGLIIVMVIPHPQVTLHQVVLEVVVVVLVTTLDTLAQFITVAAVEAAGVLVVVLVGTEAVALAAKQLTIVETHTA